MNAITVVHAGTGLDWKPVEQSADDDRPRAHETVEHRSGDGRYAVGFWMRDPEEGEMVLSEFHEVMYIIEGDVEITPEGGETIRVGPGDLVIAPQHTRGTWRAITPVKKVWSIYREPPDSPQD